MTAIAYLNGAFLPLADARVSVLDRGFLYADAVYEVAAVLDGRLVDVEAHLARLTRSLASLRIAAPLTPEQVLDVQRELADRNGVEEGLVYIQISRGAAPRDLAFPPDVEPTVVGFATRRPIRDDPRARTGIRVITTPDLRWKRCDVKTVGLLAAVLAKQAAVEAGVDDAWFVDGDTVTEGTSNNAFILTPSGAIVTRQLGSDILPGVTRRAVLALAREQGRVVEERAFTVAEAQTAAEAFITSASTFVCPVVEIDGVQIGDGRPGPVARALRARYIAMVEAEPDR